MSTTFAEKMVARFEELLLESAGLKSVVIDGTQVSYEDLEAKYRYWKKKVAEEQGSAPLSAQIDLGAAW